MMTNETPNHARPPETPAPPPCLESMLALGLMAVTAVACWLLYGPLIGRMFAAMIDAAVK